MPPPSGEWIADSSFYPKVTAETISHYVSFKQQGRKGRYRKAKRRVFSRKIKTVKVIKVERNTTSVFVKALVLNIFENNVPVLKISARVQLESVYKSVAT